MFKPSRDVNVENFPGAGLVPPISVLSIIPPKIFKSSLIYWSSMTSPSQKPEDITPTSSISWSLPVVINNPLTSGIVITLSVVGSSKDNWISFSSIFRPSKIKGLRPDKTPIESAKIPVNPSPLPINEFAVNIPVTFNLLNVAVSGMFKRSKYSPDKAIGERSSVLV